MKHKIMQVMQQRETSRRLTSRVEIDDAYLGGERPGGKPGRGSENKVSFVAASQTTESGQPVLACLSRRPLTSPMGWVASKRSRARASCTSRTSPVVVRPA